MNRLRSSHRRLRKRRSWWPDRSKRCTLNCGDWETTAPFSKMLTSRPFPITNPRYILSKELRTKIQEDFSWHIKFLMRFFIFSYTSGFLQLCGCSEIELLPLQHSGGRRPEQPAPWFERLKDEERRVQARVQHVRMRLWGNQHQGGQAIEQPNWRRHDRRTGKFSLEFLF